MIKYYEENPENKIPDNITLLRPQDNGWNSYSKTITQEDILQQPYAMLGSLNPAIEQMSFVLNKNIL